MSDEEADQRIDEGVCMRMSARITTAAAAAAVVLSLASCSGGGSGTSASDEQTLTLSLPGAPGNFQIGNWSGADAAPFLSVYDTVLLRGLDGSLQPGLASSWEYNDDKTQLTLKIREGQKFSDGSTVDAAAVAASLEAARQGASTSQNLASVARVEAPDATTVVLTLTQPDAAVAETLATTAGAVGAPDALTAESSKLNPIGSGPYTLDADATTQGATYVFERNEDYWNVEAYPYERVEMKVITDPTAVLNAMKSGQIDFAQVAADDIAQFEGNSKFTLGDSQPTAYMTLWLVDKRGDIVPALADPRVRRAINMAVDRDMVVDKLLLGNGSTSNQVFNPAGTVFDKALLAETSYDVEAARALMAEAGFASGFTVKMPSTVITKDFEPTISQSLAEIGIEVEWDSIQLQDLYPKILGGDYPLYLSANSFSGSDILDLSASMSGSRNPQASTTPELEALIDAVSLASEDESAEALQAVNEYLVDVAWTAPLWVIQPQYVVSADIDYTAPVAYQVGVRPFAPAE